MDTSPVHIIVNHLGSKLIEEALGVSEYSVRAAKRDRLFPARWYEPLRRLCSKKGVECPTKAFRWIDTKHESAE